MSYRNISSIPAGWTVKEIGAGRWRVDVEPCDDVILYHVVHPDSCYIIAEFRSAAMARLVVREHNAALSH